MKTVFLTSKIFPGGTADHVYVQKFAESLAKVSDFKLTVDKLKSPEVLAPVPVYELNLGASRRALTFLRRFPEVHKRLRCDVYISNDPYMLVTLGLYRALYSYKVCSDWHIVHSWWLSRVVAWSSDYFLCTTSMIEKYLRRIGAKNILISPMGIDLRVFDLPLSRVDARNILELPSKRIIGYTGRFKALGMEKGLSFVLAALKTLDAAFVAAGGKDDELKEYQALAENMGVANKVVLRGNSTQKELATYQKAADVLVIAYPPGNKHFAEFVSPMKMFEYMASRRPIIASDLPSLREVLDESNSILYEAGNQEQFKAAVERILCDEALSQTLAAKAFEDVKNYTWDIKAAKVLKFICER